MTLQLAFVSRSSEPLFTADNQGDLIFNGVASRVDRSIFSNGVQFDASWAINDAHTLRGGFLVTIEKAVSDNRSLVFPTTPAGTQASDVPMSITDNSSKTGLYYGFYLQDEWKVFPPLTINFVGRFLILTEFAHQSPLTPTQNILLQSTSSTTLHAVYS